MNLWHAVIGLAGMAAASTLAAFGVLPGADAQTVIVGVLVGAGVLAGTASVNASLPSAPPAPAPLSSSTDPKGAP